MEMINKKLLGSQVEDELLNYILEEPLEVGQKIPNEFELAERFGVGRSTIREAVKGLVSRGILMVKRGSGTYVVSTSSLEYDPMGFSRSQDKYKMALDLLEMRLMLEPELASKAAQNASIEEKMQLEAMCDEVERLYREGKNQTKKDMEFHAFIAACSRNQAAKTLIPMINTAILTFENQAHKDLLKENIDTHRAVTNAILSEDPVGAKFAMIMHLTYNRQALMKEFEE